MSLLSTILLTVGLALAAGGLAVALNEHYFISRGTVTEGTVAENVRRGKGYTPRITFRTPQGRETSFMPSFTSKPPSYDVGEKVRVVYRGDGEGARILSFALRFGLAWPLICMGLALALLAIGFKYGDSLLVSKYVGSALTFRG